jgi:hypothetical protein
MKNGIILVGIVFAIVLAIVVGSRLSDEAMAVVVGAVCGISASIPMSLGLAIAASRNWGRNNTPREIEYDYSSQRFAPQPPVYIVAPPQQPMPYGFAPNQQYIAPPNVPMIGAPREFKIVGEE